MDSTSVSELDQLPTSKESASVFPTLVLLGVAMLGLFAGLLFLSNQFAPDSINAQRPILEMLALYGMAFAFYLYACHRVWRHFLPERIKSDHESARRCLLFIFVIGLLFRSLTVFSTPMLEVDIYRYVWDGFVTTQTGDPYDFAPLEVTQLDYPPMYRKTFARTPVEMEAITQLAEKANTNGYKSILNKVHFGEYTSPYPPVSQAVFALSSWVTPQGASASGHLLVMKVFFLVFDLATAIVVVFILRHAGLPSAFVIAYWWCPLLIKEVTNSGHLDAIAIFFSAVFVLLTVRSCWIRASIEESPTTRASVNLSCFAALTLAIAVGAKIYPAVLGPIWFFITVKRLKLKAIFPLAIFFFAVVAINWPILKYVGESYYSRATSVEAVNQSTSRPLPGITAFAKSWEMNDLLFMVAVENIKPPRDANASHSNIQPWFVVTSNRWRTQLSDWRLGTRAQRQANNATSDPATDEFESAFRFTRLLLLVAFFAILLWLSKRLWQQDSTAAFVETAFLSIAWFWLLSPTQNPWYWCWGLPFLPFVRNRIWFLFSGVVFAYYLRFYFDYHFHFSQGPIAGTSYSGTQFYDFVIPFIEFGPLLILLALSQFKPIQGKKTNRN